MRFIHFTAGDRMGIAIADRGHFFGIFSDSSRYPGDLLSLIAAGPAALQAACDLLLAGEQIDPDAVTLLPPIPNPAKIICVGLNYTDHTAESGFAEQPDYPALFGRFASSLVGHQSPIIRPRISKQLDYEGEIVAVIGRGGRHIPREKALDHVMGYALFNDGSIRDYQFKTGQWTVGKNFDQTGAFGPFLVTADELPPGCKGLRLQTRLNGAVVQDASTSDMVFDVATLVTTISEAITLEPGDLIVTGTPSGVGVARKPPLFMKPGDICEVEVEGLGTLMNSIADEAWTKQVAA